MNVNPLGADRLDLQWAINPSDPSFLASLEHWHALALISDEDLRHFCATILSCPCRISLPIPASHPNLLVGLDHWLVPVSYTHLTLPTIYSV